MTRKPVPAQTVPERSDAEKDALRRANAAKWMRDHLTKWLTDHPSDRMIAIAEKTRDYAEQVSWDSFGFVLRAQSMRKQAFDITTRMDRIEELHIDEGQFDSLALAYVTQCSDETLFKAYAKWADYQVHRGSYRDPLSRSTNALSNLVEDMDDWAAAQIMREVREIGGTFVAAYRTEVA